MRLRRTTTYGCIIPIIFVIMSLTGCAGIGLQQYAEWGTLGTLVVAKASVEDAQELKGLFAEIEAVAHLDRATIEKVLDSGIAKIKNDKVRKGMVKLKPKLIDQVIKYAQRNPLVKLRIHIVEITQGGQSGCTIYITAKE